MRPFVLSLLLPLLPLHAQTDHRCGTYLFRDEAVRLDSIWGRGPEAWEKAGVAMPRAEYNVGDRKTFYSSIGSRWVPATLRVKGTHCYLWAEDALWGVTIAPSQLSLIRAMFDDSTFAEPSRGIYEIDVEAFGDPPDIDNDPRIHILVLDIGGEGVGGYFRPANEYPTSVEPTSNELDMFYYDDNLNPQASRFAAAVPAHEFQHMINWNQDADEELWINEGCSGLAELLVGYLNAGGWAATWAQHTDGSLTDWVPEDGDYFGTALFAIYLYDQFGGTAFSHQLLAEPANGITGVEQTLLGLGHSLSFRELFKRWALANLLDNPSPSFYGGVYGYQCINLPVAVGLAQDHSIYPVPLTSDQVGGWGVDYIRLRDGGLMQWAVTATYDQWRRVEVLQVCFPLSAQQIQVYDRGAVMDTLMIPLDGFAAEWDPAIMAVCNTSPWGSMVIHRSFTLPHPAAPGSLAGWPVTDLGMLAASPVVAGGLVAAVDRNGTAHLMDASGQPLPGWPLPLGSQLWATPTLADVDGDGCLEVAIGTRGGVLHLLDVSGNEKPGWPVTVPSSTFGLASPVAAADVDGDGLPELIASSFSGHLYCLRHDGTPVEGWPVDVGASLYTSPAVGDVDRDGSLEVAVASTDNAVHLFSSSGAERPGWPVSIPGRSWSGVALANLGTPAVIVADETGSVTALGASGGALPGWPASVGGRVQAPCAVGDLDQDDRLEIVVTTLAGAVWVLDGSGNALPGWPRSAGAEIWGSPVIADLDGDGAQELVVCSKQGRVSVYEADATCTTGWPLLLGQQAQAGAAAADLDGNLMLDLVIPGLQGQLQTWALNVPLGESDSWPQTGRGPAHTSSLLDQGVGAPPQPTRPTTLSLRVMPVPVVGDPMVRIDGAVGRVTVSVYDLRGARVATRVAGPMERAVFVRDLGPGAYVLAAQDESGTRRRLPLIILK